MTTRIILISCCKQKLEGKHKARDLYISSLFKRSLKYAESIDHDKIFIFSAKYGLVEMEQEIKSYDLTLNNQKKSFRENWANEVFEKLKKITDIEKNEYLFLTGKKYSEYLIPKLKHTKDPMKGLSQGKRLAWLKKETENE
ncbi:MAG: hypothetical protein LBC20_13885 [Planctomycetaceae bacterium]|jgi:hypothetical protein|nr:hypothetical protein [Planctomycetaceae bacterium]